MIFQLKMKWIYKKHQLMRTMTKVKSIQSMNVRTLSNESIIQIFWGIDLNTFFDVSLIWFFFIYPLVLHEIQERMDWLEEMEKLGEGRTYKALIKSEIEERLRAIKRLQPTEPGVKQWFFLWFFLPESKLRNDRSPLVKMSECIIHYSNFISRNNFFVIKIEINENFCMIRNRKINNKLFLQTKHNNVHSIVLFDKKL